MGAVRTAGEMPPQQGSELTLETLRLDPGANVEVGDAGHDVLLFVFAGVGALAGEALPTGSAALLLEGESTELTVGDGGLAAVRVLVGGAVDRHAPMGAREWIVSIDRVEAGSATGKRSFQVLFGPHNGSTRATLFVGYIPPGASPWHFHLYDEIVWIWRGEGRYHTRGGVEPLAPGCAFRISPREVHIVENTSPSDELVVLGLFAPAGSPSAAYLAGGTAEYLLEAAS